MAQALFGLGHFTSDVQLIIGHWCFVLRPEVTKGGCAACPSTSTSSSRVLEYVEERRKIGVRSERRLCEEVHLNLAYRWFCQLGRKLAKLIPIPALQPS